MGEPYLISSGAKMKFEYYLREQLSRHPTVMPQDIIKMCYQAAYGAEHLLSDTEGARKYLEMEYSAVVPSDGELYEMISDSVCRVNLSVWKKKRLPFDLLFSAFVSSVRISENGSELFEELISEADELVQKGAMPFSAEAWSSFLAEYRRTGMPAVHHSERYRKNEAPAYRIVRSALLKELLLQTVEEWAY